MGWFTVGLRLVYGWFRGLWLQEKAGEVHERVIGGFRKDWTVSGKAVWFQEVPGGFRKG